MARRKSRLVRLLKLGFIGGVVYGIVKAVMNRRNDETTSESSWPTIAETAASDGRNLDDSAGAEAATEGEAAAEDSGDESDDAGDKSDKSDDAGGAEKKTTKKPASKKPAKAKSES